MRGFTTRNYCGRWREFPLDSEYGQSNIEVMVRSPNVFQKSFLALLFALLVSNLSAQTFSVIHYFTNVSEGLYPVGSLIADGDTLYGTTRVSVFKINTDGSGYTVLKHLTDSDGALLGTTGALVLGGTNLFGIATQGGSNFLGTIFRISTNGDSFTVLRNFTGVPDGSSSYYSGLTLSSNTLYGVTESGGSNNFGTVFKINTDGSGYSILRHFESSPDGGGPRGTLVLDGNTLYGETSIGGSNSPYGGTIFKLNTGGGGYAVLKHFYASDTDGKAPSGGLVISGDTLYGTTGDGGSNQMGTAFKLNTDGTGFAILHHFVNIGSRPSSGVILAGNTLYGTTATIPGPDNGTVFGMKTDGSDFATIKSFSAFANATYRTNSDGASPQAGFVVSGDALYGVASIGGLFYLANDGLGTVFKITLPQPLRILVNDSGFGVQSNSFGFGISGNSNQTILIEASTNLATSGWLPLQTNTLGASPFYFSDPDWTNYSGRFYRARSL